MNLKEHMADVHQMRRMAPSERSGTYTSSSYYPETRTEREVTTFSGRERYGENPEASRREEEVTTFSGRNRYEESPEALRREEEVNRWRYASPGEEGGRRPTGEAQHGGGWGHRMWHRYDEMTMSTRCPICDTTIRGSDDEDLSDELRFHFKDAHRDLMKR